MKKQFNLQDWLKDKSQKVETRSGLPVRIICWDRRGERPLVALIQHPNGYDEGLFYYENGLADGVGQESDSDLFLVTPEEEMTDFEAGLFSAFSDGWQQYLNGEEVDMEQWAKEHSEELLSIARKQLQPEIDAGIEKAFQTADEVQYRKGREEALKDLPRWRKIEENGRNYSDSTQFVINGRYLEMNDTLNDVYEIALSDLAKLPKEDSHE